MNFFKYNDNPLISSYKFKIKLEGIEITKINSISASASINADIKFSISIPAVDGVLNLLPKTVCEVYMQDANFYAYTVIEAFTYIKSYKIGDVLNQNEYNSYLAKIQGDLAQIQGDLAQQPTAPTFFKKTKPWVLMCVGELDTINYSRTPSSVFCNMQFTGLFGNFQHLHKCPHQ